MACRSDAGCDVTLMSNSFACWSRFASISDPAEVVTCGDEKMVCSRPTTDCFDGRSPLAKLSRTWRSVKGVRKSTCCGDASKRLAFSAKVEHAMALQTVAPSPTDLLTVPLQTTRYIVMYHITYVLATLVVAQKQP